MRVVRRRGSEGRRRWATSVMRGGRRLRERKGCQRGRRKRE